MRVKHLRQRRVPSSRVALPVEHEPLLPLWMTWPLRLPEPDAQCDEPEVCHHLQAFRAADPFDGRDGRQREYTYVP